MVRETVNTRLLKELFNYVQIKFLTFTYFVHVLVVSESAYIQLAGQSSMINYFFFSRASNYSPLRNY